MSVGEVHKCVLEFVVRNFVRNIHFFDAEGFFEIYFHFSNSYKLQLAPDQLRDMNAGNEEDRVESHHRFTKRKTLNINVNSPMFFCNTPNGEQPVSDAKPQAMDSHSLNLSQSEVAKTPLKELDLNYNSFISQPTIKKPRHTKNQSTHSPTLPLLLRLYSSLMLRTH